MHQPWQPHTTADGSITFFSPEFQETFHSSSGAKEEAVQKFVVPSGLGEMVQGFNSGDRLKILDVCYGLGYNSAAALEAVWTSNPRCRVDLRAWELDATVSPAAVEFLATYPSLVWDNLTTLARELAVSTPQFEGRLEIGDARDSLQRLDRTWQADVIFLDPFSPPKCPQLWTVEFIALLVQHLQPQGKLVTYSCAAAVRQALIMAGLHIASTPSVGRKNPGTIASPSPLDFPALTAAEIEYLHTRAAIPYRDEYLKDDAETIRKRRYEEQARSKLESTSQWKKRWRK